MALQKEVQLDTGYTADYHRVSIIDLEQNRVVVELYKDKAARDAGSQPIKAVEYYVSEDTFSEDAQKVEGKSVKVIAYDYLAALEEFEGAINV